MARRNDRYQHDPMIIIAWRFSVWLAIIGAIGVTIACSL